MRHTTPRLLLPALALLFEAAHLTWEATHGGIVTHHLLQRADLPGLSNAWGLIVLPALAAWAASRWPAGAAGHRRWLAGLLLPLLMGAALGAAFSLHWQALTESLFFALLLAALVFSVNRPECLFGLVLGLAWTLGALLPTALGCVLAALSWAVHAAVRRLWRRRATG